MENPSNVQANTPNPQETKENKLTANETEIYFNSLLREQQEEFQNPTNKNSKMITYGILVAIIAIGMYFAVNFYVNANNLTANSGSSSLNGDQSNSAYFTPDYYANRERKISGKVAKNPVQTTDKTTNFELEGNDGKNIAYIYSNTNDLNLSVGLVVEIQGEYRSSTESGKEVIEVFSIKLK